MIKFNLSGEIEKLEVMNAKQVIKDVLYEVTTLLQVKGNHILSYIIVDNAKIHQINLEYRGIDRPTDVITFASIDDERNGIIPEELGDIFISYEKVQSQALEYGHSNLREFAFLVTHGALHSLGYDHQTADEEKEMFGLQEEILNRLKIGRTK